MMKKTISIFLLVIISLVCILSLSACNSTRDLSADKCMEEYISKIELNKRYDYLECEVYLYESVSKKLTQETYILQEGNIYTSFDDLSTDGLDSQILIKQKESGWHIHGKTFEDFTRSEAITEDEVNTFRENIYNNILFFNGVAPFTAGEILKATKGVMEINVEYIHDGIRYLMTMNRYTNKIHRSVAYHKEYRLTEDTTPIEGKGYYIASVDVDSGVVTYERKTISTFEPDVVYYEYVENGSFTLIEYTYPIAGYNKTELPEW